MSGRELSITASDDGKFTGYLATPQGTGPHPGVLIIQEIFGVNQHIRDEVDRYAGWGYVTLAPDMFWRVKPKLDLDYTDEGRSEGMATRGKFDRELGMNDIESSLKALRALPESNGKVAVVGYCFGGTVAYLSAARTDVAAASCYYGGGLDQVMNEAKSVRCPIQFHFGTEDKGIPSTIWDKVREAFAGRKDAEVFVYSGAEHGFNCDRRSSFNPDASKLARERTLGMLRGAIGPAR